jgi:hypothetical protein
MASSVVLNLDFRHMAENKSARFTYPNAIFSPAMTCYVFFTFQLRNAKGFIIMKKLIVALVLGAALVGSATAANAMFHQVACWGDEGYGVLIHSGCGGWYMLL